MYRTCGLLAGLVLAAVLSGCSEGPPESGTVPYKPTQSPAIEAFSKQMAENVAAHKTGKPAEGATKACATETKAEKKD